MKQRISLLILSFSLALHCSGQHIQTTLGLGIDTIHNPDVKAIYTLWKCYLSSSPDSIYDNPCWNMEEKENYVSYDFLKSEAYLSPSLYRLNTQNTVLSISDKGDYWIISSTFYWVKPKESKTVTAATAKVVARKENGEFKLFNYLPYHVRSWYHKRVGIIEYCYHPSHPFDLLKAQEANTFIEGLKKTFNIKVDHVTYYIAPNCDELFELKGFDFVLGMGRTPNVCGFFDHFNTIIYSTSQDGENHNHELIHLLNNFFPRGHGLFLTGLSAYWGGASAHLGQNFAYHLKRVNVYLIQHPEVNLSNLDSFYEMDDQTSSSYITGGVLCHLVLEKGGIPLLKEGLNAGDSMDDLYKFLESKLGIKRTDLNKYLRRRIREMAEDPHFSPLEFP